MPRRWTEGVVLRRADAQKARAELQLEEATTVSKAIDKALSALRRHEQQVARHKQQADEAAAAEQRARQQQEEDQRQREAAAQAEQDKVSCAHMSKPALA